jgi:hypothetical protein
VHDEFNPAAPVANLPTPIPPLPPLPTVPDCGAGLAPPPPLAVKSTVVAFKNELNVVPVLPTGNEEIMSPASQKEGTAL